MRVIDLTDELCPLYHVCLEDWSPEMAEAGGHKAAWHREFREKGLRVKLAEDDDGAIAGMIQYLPIEHSPLARGRDAYMVLCVWVHEYDAGVGRRQGRGMGRALLRAAEEDALGRGARSMVAWGLAVPFWMRARWFRRQGYRAADRDGAAVLLWKPFDHGAEPPVWRRPRRRAERGAERVRITTLVNGWCPGRNIVAERARLAAADLGDAVELEVVETRSPDVLDEWGMADAIFVDGRRLRYGPPPSKERVRRRFERAMRRRALEQAVTNAASSLWGYR